MRTFYENTANNVIFLREDQIIQEGPAIKAKGSAMSCTALVINASLDMAREITIELSRAIPDCNIMFAPTLELAIWLIKRRPIDLVLTSEALPDGSLAKLHSELSDLEQPPELLVLGDFCSSSAQFTEHSAYRFVELRRLSSAIGELQGASTADAAPNVKAVIEELGADIRNDLNNPLQEIVAMAFVAQSSNGLSPAAEQALTAIERAAKSMSHVVNGIEDKIKSVVQTG